MSSSTAAVASRWFVALLPAATLQAQVIALQTECRDRYHSQAALRSPPHITLQPPFHWPLAEAPHLQASLQTWAATQPPIPISITGWGAFPPRVIYLRVEPSPALCQGQAQLQAYLQATHGIGDRARPPRPFVPHLTIAFRDLTPTAFTAAWAELSPRAIAATDVVTALTLLHHDGQRWQIAAQFPLLRSD